VLKMIILNWAAWTAV